MKNQEIDILILRYLNGDMNPEEITEFETRISSNASLKQHIEEYQNIELGVKNFAKNEMRTKLLAAQSTVIATKGLKNYKPSINGGGGFNIFSFIPKMIVLGGILTVALIYFDKIPLKHEFFEKANEKLHSFDTIFNIRYDTIWTTIPANQKLNSTDTVYIKTQEQLDSFKSIYNE